MSNLAQFPDEPPTKPSEPFPSRVLILASRIERAATDALDRLRADRDVDGAAALLVQIQALAAEVTR